MRKIAVTSSKIISVLKEEGGYYFGFDLITNKYMKVKTSKCVINPPILCHLIKNEDLRIDVINNLYSYTQERADALNITVRTYHRKISEQLKNIEL